MNLIEFIAYLKDSEKVIHYLNEHYPDIDYYDSEIYLKNSLSIESELVIFDCEKIEGTIVMEINNEKYYNLFSLDHLVEVFEDYSKFSENYDTIAMKIINYRINDA